MKVSDFLLMFSDCTGFIGALFFSIGIIRQRVPTMGMLSGTFWDANPHMPPALAAQKADYLFGGGLIVVTFAVQFASFMVPPTAIAVGEEHAQVVRWTMAALTLVAIPVLMFVSKSLGKRYERQVNEWLQRQQQSREKA